MSAAHQYDADDFQARPAEILDEVESGEEVIINRAGEPVAKVVPLRPEIRREGRGMLRGQLWISDDFDEPDEEIERMFGTRP